MLPKTMRHDVDGGAQVVGDLLAVAIVVGALAEPGGEDGLDGEVELLVGVGRELAAGVLANDLLVLDDEVLEVLDREVGVLGVGPWACLRASRGSSKRSAFTPMTMRPNMPMKRR